MLAAFVCLNVLIGLILMWLTTAYYETFWKKSGDQEGDANNKTVQKSLYQAAVLVFCCANMHIQLWGLCHCVSLQTSQFWCSWWGGHHSFHFKNGHDPSPNLLSPVSDTFCCFWWTKTMWKPVSISSSKAGHFKSPFKYWHFLTSWSSFRPLQLPSSLYLCTYFCTHIAFSQPLYLWALVLSV